MKHTTSFFNLNRYKIFYQSWIPKKTDAVILISHGLGEHSGRYNNLAKDFNKHNIATFAHDFRGHGKSEGKRGCIKNFEDYTSELNQMYTIAKKLKKPIFILGQSNGSIIALHYALSNKPAGLILSSPNMKIKGHKGKLLVGKILSKVWPTFTLKSDVSPFDLSHDDIEDLKFDSDPLNHDRVSARWVTETMRIIRYLKTNTDKIKTPLLMLLGKEDHIIDIKDATNFFNSLKTKDKTLKIFPGFYHEVLNEKNNSKARTLVINWIKKHKA